MRYAGLVAIITTDRLHNGSPYIYLSIPVIDKQGGEQALHFSREWGIFRDKQCIYILRKTVTIQNPCKNETCKGGKGVSPLDALPIVCDAFQVESLVISLSDSYKPASFEWRVSFIGSRQPSCLG